MQWETVIGLEIHVQLATISKLFSGSPTTFGAQPNSQANIIDLAMPGTLPVLNKQAVNFACRFGLAINAKINNNSIFARKNYFYPDLPKGYQISQFDLPIVGSGELTFILEDGTSKTINITRAHLEEDAGKSLHEDFHGKSGIDLNRAGIPLLEIVSEPELRSAKEAVAFLKTLHTLVRYLEISDANMQEGSFRCDANVSLRPMGASTFGTRAEIKNLNSFKFIEKAINHEIARQQKILESGGTIIQETRLYDADKNETRSMRSKEAANDYRYFPDPDLLPVHFADDYLEKLRNDLPELPWDKKARYVKDFKLTEYDAALLVSSKALAQYFENVLITAKLDQQPDFYKLVANWISGDFLAALNKNNLEVTASPISVKHFTDLMLNMHDNTISGKIAKTVFEALWNNEGDVASIIATKGLTQITDTKAIEAIIDSILANNQDQVTAYKNGKDKLFGFFVGQVMKETRGTANPNLVNQLLLDKLKK